MVVPTIQQPPNTYLLWTKFKFPDANLGPVTAFAVPAPVYRYIQNGYALLSTIMVVNLWAIVMVFAIYMQLTTPKTGSRVNGMAMSLWNTKDAPRQSAIATLLYARKKWNQWWYYPFVLVLAGAWIASLAAGIFLPSRIFLGSAAPVNPSSIYVPTRRFPNLTTAETFSKYALEGEGYMRAAAAALVASDETRAKVVVSPPAVEGTWNSERSGISNETVQRIDYGYSITGTDLGLQNIPQLVLTVTGSCVTDYTWLNMNLSTSENVDSPMIEYYQDVYRCPWSGVSISANAINSPGPSATFCVQDPGTTAQRGNVSWGVVIASVDQMSITTSRDPWYLTTDHLMADLKNLTRILPGRPALSCWQDDVWSYKDRSTDVTQLQSILPPNTLSDATADILAHNLGGPVVVSLGIHIGTAALQSYRGTVNRLFDAGKSSIYRDVSALVLGAYIATINSLADTTLHRDHESTNTPDIRNLAREEDDDGKTRPDVGQFIVFSDQVASLSLTLVILIPFLTIVSWLLMHSLLEFTPLKLTKAMEPTELLRTVRGQFGHPTLYIDKDGRERWKFESKQNDDRLRDTESTQALVAQPLNDGDHSIANQLEDHETDGATPLVNITSAPRLDMDIPLLSPLSTSPSLVAGETRIDTVVSRESSINRPRYGHYHGNYDDDDEANNAGTYQLGKAATSGSYQHLVDDEEHTTARQRGRTISPLHG